MKSTQGRAHQNPSRVSHHAATKSPRLKTRSGLRAGLAEQIGYPGLAEQIGYPGIKR